MITRIVLALLVSLPLAAAPKAKNVILFLADAGGTSTIHAASLHGYDEPLKLFIQGWPNVALSDTSTASAWVTDSAAGMTAIVTGVKTQNGVISQGPDAVRGKQDGKRLKTILEYAEERGLSTAVVTNMVITDATPAACYAHANDRRKWGEIFRQMMKPDVGDGVDVAIGAGRSRIPELEQSGKEGKRMVYSALAEVPPTEARPVVVMESNVDVPAAARLALRQLKKNKKGYFLMIEWDAHTDNVKKGLDALVGFDKLIREISQTVNLKDTLLIFTADHSFDIRSVGGRRGTPVVTEGLRMNNGHTGEEVLAVALGPGADQVKGYLPNTRLFEVMLKAYGWKR